MSQAPNIFDPGPWERDLGSARGSRLAARAGAAELGMALYELDAGAQAAPYHVHHANEELLVVLAGEVEVRSPDGVRTLAAGDLLAFPAGPDGAHRVRNAGGDRARYLMVSTMRFPEVCEQLDTGTVLAMKGPADGWAFAADGAGDYMELTRQALESERQAESG
ncbi:MAG: cupin domain-containing protein [Acidobacteriota bacterium]|nr:cupin domain-containing protein [Acidobacteriota bacterium]